MRPLVTSQTARSPSAAQPLARPGSHTPSEAAQFAATLARVDRIDGEHPSGGQQQHTWANTALDPDHAHTRSQHRLKPGIVERAVEPHPDQSHRSSARRQLASQLDPASIGAAASMGTIGRLGSIASAPALVEGPAVASARNGVPMNAHAAPIVPEPKQPSTDAIVNPRLHVTNTETGALVTDVTITRAPDGALAIDIQAGAAAAPRLRANMARLQRQLARQLAEPTEVRIVEAPSHERDTTR